MEQSKIIDTLETYHRAAEEIPASEETARATTSVAPEEQDRPPKASVAAPEESEQVRTTASVVPKETAQKFTAPPAPTPSHILPSAS